MTVIHWANLNWIDYTILAIVLLSLLIGIVRGFVCEVISLITWIVAFILAFEYAAPVAAHFTFIKSPAGGYVLAFAGIFIIVLIIGISINVLVRQMWQRTGVPAMDRLLGLLLGIVRGVLIIAFILLFVKASPLNQEETVKNSQLIPLFNPIVTWLQKVLPEKIVHISEWMQPSPNPTNSNEKTNNTNTSPL